MVVSLPRSIGHDDLHAAVCSVVGSLALLAVAMTHVVGIGLLKLSRNKKTLKTGEERIDLEQHKKVRNHMLQGHSDQSGI
jgi:hypothetical protein